MAHPHAKEAKASHDRKLTSFGGKSKGIGPFKGDTFDGVPPVNTSTQRGLAPKPGLAPEMGGPYAKEYSKGGKARLDRKPRAKGGKVWEGSAKDEREDKKLAKEHGMSMKAWEKSDADKKHDRAERASGGRTGKGKTVVNVVVAPHGGGQPSPVPVPVPHPVPVGGPPPAMPPAMPPGGMGAMPPGIAGPPMGGGPAGLPPGLVGRKSGGRVHDMSKGSGEEGDSAGKGSGPEGDANGKGTGPEGNSFDKGSDGENPRPAIREKFGAAGGLGRLEKAARQRKVG